MFHTWEINHILKWIYSYPKLVERYVEYIAICCAEVAKVKIDMGFDVCFIDCDWAYRSGPFVSPNIMKKIRIPNLGKVVDIIHKKGSLVVAHADGDIGLLLRDMVEAGIDGYHAIEPPYMNIDEVKQKYGDKISLWGNINLSFPLAVGTPEDTKRSVRECIKAASPGGGHIICSCNYIQESVKTENYLAMCEDARKYGKYMIKA